MKRFTSLRSAAQLFVAFVACAAFLSGCSSVSKITAADTKNGKLFAVAADKTSFYRYGPQQGNGPDETLPKDTLMTLIRPSFGYCKVQLVAGAKEGYVASEDIRPAPPTLVASLTAPPPSVTASSQENFDIRSTEPPPPETLPDPDLPPASDVPAPTPQP
ncbi:MAG: hypothetical protein M3Y86_07010 [Verrucomicrobiota bacterium]|nr:hypothetical protein [Verrucomicrobiota bacterium]